MCRSQYLLIQRVCALRSIRQQVGCPAGSIPEFRMDPRLKGVPAAKERFCPPLGCPNEPSANSMRREFPESDGVLLESHSHWHTPRLKVLALHGFRDLLRPA